MFNFEHEGRKVPYTCTQCTEAWCLNSCPVDAIRIDLTTGAKMVFEDTCVGCKVCTIACPFGTINYNQDSGKVQKCDLCEGNPACASACPTGAITYVDADWTTPLPVRGARALGAQRGLTIEASAHLARAPPRAERY